MPSITAVKASPYGNVTLLKDHVDDFVATTQEYVDLKEALIDMTRDRDHWKANHDNQVKRARVLIERGDLPIERILCYQQILEWQRDGCRLDWLEATFDAEALLGHQGSLRDAIDDNAGSEYNRFF